jgi:signal transduction histidine kinase/CheY-like chemotaxis protein
VQEDERRYYCVQPPDETDARKREMLQNIRSSALAARTKPVPESTGTPGATVEWDAAFVGEFVAAIDAGLGVFDVKRDEVILNVSGRELLGLPASAPMRIPSGRLRAHLRNTLFPRDKFDEFWAGFVASETTQTNLRRALPYEVELALKSAPFAGSQLGLLQISKAAPVAAVGPPVPGIGTASDGVDRITGGIAHEFNNLLSPIIGNLSLIEESMGEGGSGAVESLREGIESSLTAAHRAAALVADLLCSSGRGRLSAEQIDANALAVAFVGKIHSDEDNQCVLHLNLDDQLWPVSGDESMVSNLLAELLKNALEVRSRDGEIRITTRNCSLDDPEVARRAELEPGDYIVISVGDNGPGMPTELGERIFEPFFSTKPPGEGVGLGLSAALGIARRHGGTLRCTSAPGEGTTFSVFLPRCKARGAVHVAPLLKCKASRPAEGGEVDLILIVDDEPLVRRLAGLALEKAGFQTLTAANGAEALSQIDSRPGEIDLIVLDLTMPRLSGQETIAELNRRGLTIPVVICSGYVAQVEDLHAAAPQISLRVLDKPYLPSALVDAVSAGLLSS